MRLAEGDTLDDALELFHSHQWQAYKPQISAEQMAELVPVLAPLFQQSRPKVRSEKPQARANSKVDRGSQSQGRKHVGRRSGGVCEAWIPDVCTHVAREWHHRLNRSQGGRWDASNGLHLCTPCHDYVTNKGREEAKKNGWAVVPGITPPIEVPVLRRGVLVFLDDEGGFEPAERVA